MDAKEAAEILDTTTAAVNSALQRARETMKQGERKTTPSRLNEQLSALLARYVKPGKPPILPRWSPSCGKTWR